MWVFDVLMLVQLVNGVWAIVELAVTRHVSAGVTLSVVLCTLLMVVAWLAIGA